MEWLFAVAAWFVLGSVGFWVLSVSALLFAFWCVDKDAPLWGSFAVLASALLILTGNGLSPVALVTQHWLWTGVAALLYFPIGTGYMWRKWIGYVDDRIDAIGELKRGFLKRKGVEVEGKKNSELNVPNNFRQEWNEELVRGSRTIYPNGKQRAYDVKTAFQDLTPKFTEHKALATGWIMNWPIYFVWFAIADSVKWFFRTIRRIASEIYYAFRTKMQNIADRRMERIKKDFAAPEPEPEAPATDGNNGTPGGSPNDGRSRRQRSTEYIG